MKKLVIAAATLALFSVAAGSAFAEVNTDKVTAKCEKTAKKNHIADDKMEGYVKSCVEKHQKAANKVASAKKAEAAPAAAPAAAPEAAPAAAPAAGM